jgi:tRNA dimethylallyltransferase
MPGADVLRRLPPAWRFLEGEICREVRETGIAATRQLAKRQLTWLRGLPGIEPAERLAAALEEAATRA